MQGNGALVILRRHQDILRSSIRRMSNTPRQLSPLSHSSLLEVLLDCFIGDFDNYEQVLQDRAKGMEPREGGGHEHIHCAVRRIDSYLTTEQFDPLRDYERHSKSLSGGANIPSLLAFYYFNGNPQNLFRARCYTLHDGIGEEVQMRLWKLAPPVVDSAIAAATDGIDAMMAAAVATIGEANSCAAEEATFAPHRELRGCEVCWRLSSTGRPTVNHDWGASGGSSGSSVGVLEATMKGGGCIVESERSPGQWIRVEDELQLTEHRLLINDRGFDLESGAIVYGNHRGVPYDMKRVTGEPPEGETDLRWTLGMGSSPP